MGKGRAGETIRFRIRVTDNRAFDDPKLTPQEVVFPPSGWSKLKLDLNASPLDQQDIVCQRDSLQDAITATSQWLKEAADEADAIRIATAGEYRSRWISPRAQQRAGEGSRSNFEAPKCCQ